MDYGDVLEAQERFAEAANWWEQRASETHLVEDICQAALANTKLKLWSRAELLYHAALKEDVSSVEAMQGLSLLAIERDDLREDERLDAAYFWIRRALSFEESSDVLYILSIVHELKQQPDAARADLERSLAKDPDNLQSLERLVELEIDSSGLNAAKANLDRLIGLDPDNAVANQALGRFAQHAEQYDVARDHYKRAIQTNPADPWSYLYLGNLYSVTGCLAEARATYGQAEMLFPEDENVQRFSTDFKERQQS
jgi:tetratricopeptide (TPR) repeat protein